MKVVSFFSTVYTADSINFGVPVGFYLELQMFELGSDLVKLQVRNAMKEL